MSISSLVNSLVSQPVNLREKKSILTKIEKVVSRWQKGLTNKTHSIEIYYNQEPLIKSGSSKISEQEEVIFEIDSHSQTQKKSKQKKM